MRWDTLRIDPSSTAGLGATSQDDLGAPREAARTVPPLPSAQLALPLPGAPGAVVRQFDTPGFAGMTFYEVRAKSIINRVSGASSVPFQWTINPYRGCTHACTYCLAGDTPILMADGRTKPLAELRVGDWIYGTEVRGSYRRFVLTQVLDQWQTVKPAYRITLADGTELIASGDHRFLTDRGWKFVTGSMSGPRRRPHLTTANKLMGLGGLAEGPKDSPDYRRGYLCGAIRGAGQLGTYHHPAGTVHRFRLALADAVAVFRAQGYLEGFGVTTDDVPPGTGAKTGISAKRESEIATITELIEWPGDEPPLDWWKGFLAGIFDARGTFARSGTLRIGDDERQLAPRISAALTALGFDHAVETACVRLRGGLPEILRFFLTVDIATNRKRSFTGQALKTSAALGVRSIEPLGLELPLFDITTGTGDFVANGVISHNCFARNTHTYLDMDAGHDFDSRVVVKVNAGELTRRELANPRWSGEAIAMGTNVDCYQRAEGRYRLMRQIISALRDFANPFSILTKGTLLLRDLDLLKQAASVTRVSLAMSIGFIDETLWRSVEPGTPSPRRRLDAVAQLSDAGFRVGVLMAPILPGLTDTEESIDATVAAIAAAGAAHVVPLPLHLRPGAKEWYAQWLRTTHPELLARYRKLYGNRSYLGKETQREITARVRSAARRHGLGSGGDSFRQVVPEATPPAPEQLVLL